MFDDSKVKYEVEFKNGTDVFLNNDDNAGWGWSEVHVIARYDGVKDVRGEDRVYFYSRVDKAVNWVTKYHDLLKRTARLVLYAHLEDVADMLGLDELIDPYEGDPRNEIADLADSVEFLGDGARADYKCKGLFVAVAGTVERVLTILRAAHGRG